MHIDRRCHISQVHTSKDETFGSRWVRYMSQHNYTKQTPYLPAYIHCDYEYAQKGIVPMGVVARCADQAWRRPKKGNHS